MPGAQPAPELTRLCSLPPARPPARSDRWCVSDEHYLSVLLAARGEAAACACAQGGRGSPTFTFWDSGAPHPRTYAAAELSSDAVQNARGCPAEAGAAALARFPSLLVRPDRWSRPACEAAGAAAAEAAAATEAAAAPSPAPQAAANSSMPAKVVATALASEEVAGAVPLLPPYACHLALRKVAPGTADEMLERLSLGLLHGKTIAAPPPPPPPAPPAPAGGAPQTAASS